MAKILLDKQKYEVLGQLVWQLRFVPPQTLLDQTYLAERLIRLINPNRKYPYDFICYKLTDYKPKELAGIDQMLEGGKVQADLARFISDVTSQAVVRFDQLTRPAITVDELADKADVSAKTVRRWEELGLAQRVVTVKDGSRQRAVLKATWEWFLDRHEKLVARATAFSRMNVAQRLSIVRQARRLFVSNGLNRHQIENELAEKVGRAPETIRYILTRHDQTADAEDRIFPTRRKITRQQRFQIWQSARRGIPISDLARHNGRSESSIYRIIHKTRQEYWLGRSINYIYSPEFDLPNADDFVKPAVQMQIQLKPGSQSQLQVLTQNEERILFRAYNYIKWRQSEFIKPYQEKRAVATRILERLDALEAKALLIRSKLVLTNRALTVSIAKRHVSASLTLEELLSEGMIPLLKSIERFDYTRGYKLSTYASWAIMKHFARIVPEHGKRLRQYVSLSQEELDLILPGMMDIDEEVAFRRSVAVQQALGHLDDREQQILANRYNIDRNGDPKSLAQLGKVMGVSKERVRQLETRAMDKMYGMLKSNLPAFDET